MKNNIYVTDTHSIVWYFTESSSLSKKALKVFQNTVDKGLIIISTIVLAEIMYIIKKGKVLMSFNETIKILQENDNYRIVPLDIESSRYN